MARRVVRAPLSSSPSRNILWPTRIHMEARGSGYPHRSQGYVPYLECPRPGLAMAWPLPSGSYKGCNHRWAPGPQ